jgi:hypothetical protein
MFLSKVRRALGKALHKGLYLRELKKGTPVIVYQMGKVGSSSIGDSLKSCGVAPVFHIHRLNPDNIEKVQQEYLDHGLVPLDESLGERLYAEVIQKRKSVKLITLVREPIGRNMSAFFQNFKRFTGVEYDDADFTVEELVNLFVEGYRHPVPLTWFDVEMKQTLDIDVYEYPFPKEKGHLTIKKGNFELLILKLEVDDAIKEKAIAEFLDVEDFRLIRANVGQDKNYARTYRDFLRTIRLPKSYVELMCTSQYTRHFYSDAEIEAVRSEWRDRIETTELPPAVHQELFKASARDMG